MSQCISLNSQNKYAIQVYGQLDGSWLSCFENAKVRVETLADNTQATTFSDVVMDQAALVGLIRRLHGLGIVLISIVRHESVDSIESKDVSSQNRNCA